MNRRCPTAAHFCGRETCDTNVPGRTNPFCGARGPIAAALSDQGLSCMRIDGHDGPHQAYGFSISVPSEWESA